MDPTKLSREMELGAGGGEAARPKQIDCGDLNMRIARDGTWFYHGSPIGRKPLVKLFASVLRREENGEYWLVTPVVPMLASFCAWRS